MTYEVPVFGQTRLPAGKPEESVITPGELAGPMGLDQAEVELGIVGEHITQLLALLANLELETQQARQRYELELAAIGARAAELRQNLENLRLTRRRLHDIRTRNRKFSQPKEES